MLTFRFARFRGWQAGLVAAACFAFPAIGLGQIPQPGSALPVYYPAATQPAVQPVTPITPVAAPPATVPTLPIADPAAAPPASPAEAMILDVIKKHEDEKKKAEDEKKKAEEARIAREGVVVGDDRKLNVTLDNGGLRYKSADEAFNLHIGGRLMADGVWFSQAKNLRASPAQSAA